MGWTYFYRFLGRESRAGVYERKSLAEQARDQDEKSGKQCTSIYYGNTRSTAKGEVDIYGNLVR